MASKCSSCGATVESQAVYCQICGQRIDSDGDAGGPKAAETPSAEQAAGAASGPADMLRATVQSAAAAGYPAETELWEGGYSPKDMIGVLIAANVVCIAIAVGAALAGGGAGWVWAVASGSFVVVNLYLGLVMLYRTYNVHYRLTSQRFVHQRGILRRVTDRIEVIDFDDITFTQGVVDRIFNVGTILIVSGDPTDPKLLLPGIDNVAHVAHLMDDARRAERRRRGLHIDQR